MATLRKVFGLSDLKYAWLLILSMALSGVFFYLDRQTAPDPFWLSVGYGVSFGIAVLWSAMNYIGHIRINAMYRRRSDIAAYVGQLAMSDEDKAELRDYLEDFARDLMNQGRSKERATAEAISQFKVRELLSLSKNTSFFQLHAHYYLFGWAVAAAAGVVILLLLEGLAIFPERLIAMSTITILTVYGFAWFCLFFVYKALDMVIFRKMHKQLTE
ncbi:hypothetical protein ACF3MZ_26440 [Paenibacillaceae bacterium WGS1546]|uniref:hypothetical protein n=1 Tax=Cohnella sp. WGS1546 TaxID=3366810 RepID=UPI00372D39E5